MSYKKYLLNHPIKSFPAIFHRRVKHVNDMYLRRLVENISIPDVHGNFYGAGGLALSANRWLEKKVLQITGGNVLSREDSPSNIAPI